MGHYNLTSICAKKIGNTLLATGAVIASVSLGGYLGKSFFKKVNLIDIVGVSSLYGISIGARIQKKEHPLLLHRLAIIATGSFWLMAALPFSKELDTLGVNLMMLSITSALGAVIKPIFGNKESTFAELGFISTWLFCVLRDSHASESAL